MTSILVTGGTGNLGSAVVRGLRERGHDVRIASRRDDPGRPDWAKVDYRTGTGLAAALDGVDTVVHCVLTLKMSVDERVAAAAARAGAHLVYVSIVGVDRVPLPYYRTKLAAEQAIERIGGPHTILRATQFHELIRLLLAGSALSPVMPVPDLPFQPIDIDEVAARCVELAEAAPAGRAPDIGGPRVESLLDLARTYLAATHRRRVIVPVRLPGKIFRGYRDGGHLAPEHRSGGRTFAEYLAAQEKPTALSYRPKR